MWETDRAWNRDLEDQGLAFSDCVLNNTLLVAVIQPLELAVGDLFSADSVWLSPQTGAAGPQEENGSRDDVDSKLSQACFFLSWRICLTSPSADPLSLVHSPQDSVAAQAYALTS